MPNFNDLPKPVRETIYALHLTHDEPITGTTHNDLVDFDGMYRSRAKVYMPPLLTLSAEIEKEAAPYYYAQNRFCVDNHYSTLLYYTKPEHLKMIRKATVTWGNTGATYTFQGLKRLKGLKELQIRVDELAMLKKELGKGQGRKGKRAVPDNPSPQQQLAILQVPGMAALLALPKMQHVKFVKRVRERSTTEYGGPIAEGVLETQIAARLMGRKLKAPPKRRGRKSFPFLSLPAELRNEIYELHLSVAGTVQPSTKEPTSASRKAAALVDGKVPDSVLSLLAVNHQIHDEALGIFYNRNPLSFEDTLHLHAFMVCLGNPRLESVLDITVHYADLSSGGRSLTELVFGQLKRMKNLRKLEIIMQGDLAKKVITRRWGSTSMRSANPASISGMKELFSLRGVTDIQIKDEVLEDRFQTVKALAAYPDFPADSRNACFVTVHKALQHFNLALAEAQKGNIQDEILEDDEWHLAKEFPSLDFEVAEDEADEEDTKDEESKEEVKRERSMEL
ncbi:hypothetical protein LTS10_005883 [Elasticomyces elasticus]|nr:hypothetical protein LTS10_005883 [Elasticomyces elasticus]